MTYFLDFDRTLFDTDAYYPYLLKKSAIAPIHDQLEAIIAGKRDQTLTGGIERIDAWDRVSALIKEDMLTFEPSELRPFVYPDVFERLRVIGAETVILTFGERERQRIKIESGLADVSVREVHYIEQGSKAEFLVAAGSSKKDESTIFVDDRPVELEAMAIAFPETMLYEMRRDGGAGDGRWPVIRSLTELP